ncbi:uncharacterized protein LAESUDRAFT_765285 [Laetiporus sulphureus 93-53]|uniref:Uncharacterized protein n=1 Tax=Laetiporus sulphureus 93-53 TaxID=1314785 RepID=A0A165AU64_9APHY|nr:uncharacterized protein LAESUDRAFT_765285 [Laetiporus sulphureus 93-53]KZS99669.1 hypothetical protein LAESUDRAFT_765285 [Laetiporus sulphureus 93-53]
MSAAGVGRRCECQDRDRERVWVQERQSGGRVDETVGTELQAEEEEMRAVIAMAVAHTGLCMLSGRERENGGPSTLSEAGTSGLLWLRGLTRRGRRWITALAVHDGRQRVAAGRSVHKDAKIASIQCWWDWPRRVLPARAALKSNLPCLLDSTSASLAQ